MITYILGIRAENVETLLKEGRKDPNYKKLMRIFTSENLNKKTDEVMSELKVERKVKKMSQEVKTESLKVLPPQLRHVIIFRKELNHII